MAYRDMNLEDVVALFAEKTSLAEAYTALDMAVPENLATELEDLRRIASDKVRDAKILSIRRMENELNALKTPKERRDELRQRIEEARGSLG